MTRRREALSQIAGPVRTEGDARMSRILERAWEAASESDRDVLTHGFHSWPARMHWAIARSLLEDLARGPVLDPFCGGGTVLVEARVRGLPSAGVDLSPLAIRVSDVRTQRRDRESRASFVRMAEAVAAASEERVRERVSIVVELPRSETRWYDAHVLEELGGLREEIRGVEDASDRRALAIVFSSILTKVSKQEADTAEREVQKRIRKGLASELFLRKARELAERWAELAPIATGPAPVLVEGDARELAELLPRRRFNLTLTSPPYGGTYDYAQHHRRRLAWLGLDAGRLRALELGSRRSATVARWEQDVLAILRSMRGVARNEGLALLVMGDAEVGGRRVAVPRQLARLAPQAGFRMIATASQSRRDWRGGREREEHLVALAV